MTPGWKEGNRLVLGGDAGRVGDRQDGFGVC